MSTFVGRLKSANPIGDIGEGVGGYLKLRNKKAVKAKEEMIQQSFLLDFQQAGSREDATKIIDKYPTMFRSPEELKTYYQVIDSRFPIEEPETTEDLTFTDDMLNTSFTMALTESQQVELAEGRDPSTFPGAENRTLSRGAPKDEHKFFTLMTGEFMGDMTMAEGKAKNLVTGQTLEENRARAVQNRAAQTANTDSIPRDSVLRAQAMLANQGNTQPTNEEIAHEVNVAEQTTAIQKSLAESFGAKFTDGQITDFKSPGDADRYQVSVDVASQMLRGGMRRPLAARMARAIAFDKAPDPERDANNQLAGGGQGPGKISSAPVEDLPSNRNDMHTGVVYKAGGAYHVLTAGGRVISFTENTLEKYTFPQPQ